MLTSEAMGIGVVVAGLNLLLEIWQIRGILLGSYGLKTEMKRLSLVNALLILSWLLILLVARCFKLMNQPDIYDLLYVAFLLLQNGSFYIFFLAELNVLGHFSFMMERLTPMAFKILRIVGLILTILSMIGAVLSQLQIASDMDLLCLPLYAGVIAYEVFHSWIILRLLKSLRVKFQDPRLDHMKHLMLWMIVSDIVGLACFLGVMLISDYGVCSILDMIADSSIVLHVYLNLHFYKSMIALNVFRPSKRLPPAKVESNQPSEEDTKQTVRLESLATEIVLQS